MEYTGELVGTYTIDDRINSYRASNCEKIDMFYIDSDHTIDATITGNHSRFINNSHMVSFSVVYNGIVCCYSPMRVPYSRRLMQRNEFLFTLFKIFRLDKK